MKQYLIDFICGALGWGLGIGDWGLGPIPNPQSPIPILFTKFRFIFTNIKYTNNFISHKIKSKGKILILIN